MMQIGGRGLPNILAAPFSKTHYIAASNIFSVYVHPVDSFKRYLLKTGDYPHIAMIKSPLGMLKLETYTYHDMLTINEIFCRRDYRADETDKVVVDFGSNIGISAAYFLTRTPGSHTYLFEPLKFNIERLLGNLKPFEGRYTLSEVAVGLSEGTAEFG